MVTCPIEDAPRVIKHLIDNGDLIVDVTWVDERRAVRIFLADTGAEEASP